jgi:hypothetical protein
MPRHGRAPHEPGSLSLPAPARSVPSMIEEAIAPDVIPLLVIVTTDNVDERSASQAKAISQNASETK